jgi:PAS domain S-box-containing protein
MPQQGDQPFAAAGDVLVSLGEGASAPHLALSRSVLDNAPVGMALKQGDGHLLWANASLAVLLARDSLELPGTLLPDLVHPEDRVAHQHAASLVLNGEQSFHQREERWLTRTGEVRWVSVSASLATTADGGPLLVGPARQRCLILQILDISPRREAEAKAAAAHDLLELRNAELERSNEDLAQFAYVASHDLSEPLRVIAGHVELLARRHQGRLDEDADRWIQFAVEGCARQRRLIEDLLRYSRVGQGHLAKVRVDTRQLLDNVLVDVAAAVEDAGASIVAAGPMPVLSADESQIGQVFTNLITNALKFRRPDVPARITVSATRVQDAWRITVADNGPGVPPQYRERVFGIFQRLHPRVVPGTGIGLPICRRVVERHGGAIGVSDSAGGGAEFWFTLPSTSTSVDTKEANA